ncbi:MAG: hypothetical protein ISS47_03010 [Candidatus Omnitrophica bacterium]|nr:hypothetical protein [Candidatus Omnitrophota bacterium]
MVKGKVLQDKIRSFFECLFDENNYQGTVGFLLILILVISFFCLPVFENIQNVSSDEAWLQNFSYYGFQRRAIVDFFQLPLWSPYFGGGYPFFAHPENSFLSPISFITLLCGEVIGLKVVLFLGYIIGTLGMFYLTRYVFKFNLAGSIFSALLFTMNSNLPYQISDGNLVQINFFYFPWLFAFFIKAKEKRHYLIVCALLMTLLLLNGASFNILTMVLFLLLFSVLSLADIKKNRLNNNYLKNLFLIVILTLFLSSVKIMPTLQLLFENDRSFDNYSEAAEGSLTLDNLYYSLFPRAPYVGKNSDFPDGTHAVDSTMYFGHIPIFLFLLSIYFCRRKLRHFFILLPIFIIFCFGKNSPIDLFKVLWHLPLFRSMHYPNKYFALYCPFIISLCVGSLFSIVRRFQRHELLTRLLGTIIIVVSINHLFWSNRVYNQNIFTEEKPRYAYEDNFFNVKSITTDPSIKSEYKYHQDGEKNALLQYLCVLKNIGLLNWYGNISLGAHGTPKYFVDLKTGSWTLNHDYVGEVYFLGKNDNQANIAYFSPNKIKLSITVNVPDRLIINQNYNRYWKTDKGIIGNHKGLLSIDFRKKGTCVAILTYVPTIFYVGLITSIISLIAVLCIWHKKGALFSGKFKR